MTKVCLVSTGQPSTNPRLVKEADVLTEQGFDVTALCSYWTDWGYKFDNEILKNAKWKLRYIGGVPQSLKYNYSRLRFRLARESYSRKIRFFKKGALSRTTPDLISAAKNFKADLYVGHNLGALPAVVEAAKYNNGKVGFDAEDFHSGMNTRNATGSMCDQLAEYFENKYLKECDYITAASYKISEKYSNKYKLDKPETILNVFPLDLRPSKFRKNNENRSLRLFWFSQSLGEGRGIEDVIKALDFLKGLNIELHLLGNINSEYKNILMGFSKENFSKIKLHSTISPNEIIQFASQFDIGLALEQPETLNRDICLTNKIFTYFLAGNAIIATNTSGQKQIINETSSAIKSYSPGDIHSLALIIRYWFENRKELEEARKASWKYGASKYNWDFEKKKFLKIIENTLN